MMVRIQLPTAGWARLSAQESAVPLLLTVIHPPFPETPRVHALPPSPSRVGRLPRTDETNSRNDCNSIRVPEGNAHNLD